MSRIMLFDLETDGLDLQAISKIHVLAVYDYQTERFYRFDKEKVSEGVRFLEKADVIVGHNIINFDVPVIQKFFPSFEPKQVLDTLVWARLVYADIKDIDYGLYNKGRLPGKYIGSHSLEAYGFRLGVLKDDFHETADWSEWSQEMSDYCEQDVRVTKALYEKLKSKGVSEEALKLEHDVAHIIKRQVDRGFYFDVEKAEELYLHLLKRRQELEASLKSLFPPWYEPNGKPFVPKRDNKRYGYKAGCEVQKIKLVEFNPSSRQHIWKCLVKKYGWEPKEFTEGGEPKIDDEILSSLPYPEAQALSEYLMIQKRIGQLAEGDKAWLKLVRNNRIHGEVITNGAVTGRMTHNNPNLAQVPAVRVPYGKECRELFCASPGYVLVGCDAAALELRCLAHFMAPYDGGAYVKTVLEGQKEQGTDIHTINMKAAGLTSRDTAKTFFYGWLYGAGDEKIGKIVGGTAKDGKRLREKFLRSIPALKKLKEAVDRAIKTRGYLIGLDGRHLKVRSSHSALNTLLQSAGALVMKKALVLLDKRLQSEGLVPGKDYEFVLNCHDEFQVETLPHLAERIGKAAVESIRQAGEHFRFRCPLDGEYRVGKNWAETH